MRLKTVRDDYAYFTQATGERTRTLVYGGIGAVWVLKDLTSPMPFPLLISLFCFCVFVTLDVFGTFYCADISRKIFLAEEEKVYRATGKLPDDDHVFDYDPKFNALSGRIFTLRPWLAVTGYAPLGIYLIMRAF